MMNAVAICLVATSLAAAGVWSPSPTASLHPPDESVIVKGGHRTVVVEYDQDGRPNTKVSISPDVNEGHGGDASDRQEHGKAGFAAKELICDAYGKCKHVISSTLGKAKDEAAEAVHEVGKEASGAKESITRKARDAKERFDDVKEGAKESVSQKAHDVKEKMGRAKDTVKEAAEEAKTAVGEKVREASEEAAEKERKAKQAAKGRVKAGARKVEEIGGLLLSLASKALAPTELMGLANLLGFAVAYGMCTWVTFVSSYVMAKALPKQQFALAQSRIYPVYFRAMAYSIGAALLGHLLSHRRKLLSSVPEMLQGCNLLSSLLMVCFNMLYLEPRATKVMFERMKLEKEEGRGRELFGGRESEGREATESLLPGESPSPAAVSATATATATAAGAAPVVDNAEEAALRARVANLTETLKNLNSYSSLLNILTLMALTWHLVYLSQRLTQTC